jgi:hypothetical protein
LEEPGTIRASQKEFIAGYERFTDRARKVMRLAEMKIAKGASLAAATSHGKIEYIERTDGASAHDPVRSFEAIASAPACL